MNPPLRTKGSHRRYEPHTVLYLTGDKNYSYIHLMSGEVVLMSHTLKWYEHRWPWLLRVHKQTLVNPAHVQQLIQASRLTLPSYLVMRNQAQLLISRRRLLQVIQHLMSHNIRLAVRLASYATPDEHPLAIHSKLPVYPYSHAS